MTGEHGLPGIIIVSPLVGTANFSLFVTRQKLPISFKTIFLSPQLFAIFTIIMFFRPFYTGDF